MDNLEQIIEDEQVLSPTYLLRLEHDTGAGSTEGMFVHVRSNKFSVIVHHVLQYAAGVGIDISDVQVSIREELER